MTLQAGTPVGLAYGKGPRHDLSTGFGRHLHGPCTRRRFRCRAPWGRVCAARHKPGGEGYPASASLAGLPKACLREQSQAFPHGERHNDIMPFEARHLGATDERAAVGYFSGPAFTPHVRMVETTRVPKTHGYDCVLAANHDGAREPIGERIIEVAPQDGERGDERVVYTACVPPGSIAAGAKIAAHGVGAAPACESCHGAKLQGVANVPYLAGRSPTYTARELIPFREGPRTSPGAAPMRGSVAVDPAGNDRRRRVRRVPRAMTREPRGYGGTVCTAMNPGRSRRDGAPHRPRLMQATLGRPT